MKRGDCPTAAESATLPDGPNAEQEPIDMRCPRCRTEQIQAAECDRCGLVFERPQRRPRSQPDPDKRRPARTSDEQIAELRQLGREVGAEVQAQVGKARTWFEKLWLARPLPIHPRIMLFRELGRALEAGLPPKEAFACLPPSARAGRMGPVVADLLDGMEAGLALHEVMRDHPDVFDRYERTVVEIAERAGNVGPLLEALARRAEILWRLRRKTIGNRPLLLMLIPVACLLWPLPVASVLGYLSGVFGWTLRFAILGVAVVIGLLWLAHDDDARERVLEWLERRPLVGPLLRRWRASDFLSALELCLRCKLAPRRAVTVAAVATGDATLLASASKLVDALDQGKLLYEAAEGVPELPDEVREAIGDSSGRLSLAIQAHVLRKSFAAGATRLGRTVHLGLAAVVVAICVASAVPMLQVDWSAEEKLLAEDGEGVIDAKGKRRDVKKAESKLHEMMPALKKADHRVQEAVRPAGGGGIE